MKIMNARELNLQECEQVTGAYGDIPGGGGSTSCPGYGVGHEERQCSHYNKPPIGGGDR
ncbi:hypothetical protein [Enterovibrio norvegicus]|uniref:hypothetical protein n=1 Tax=Enterovibrio norvegicus TaxID=188144 RepID=UPI003552330F